MESEEYRRADVRFPASVLRYLAGMLARWVLTRLVLGVVAVAVLWGVIR